MTSWRDSVSAAAQDDIDRLVDATLEVAFHLVERHGEFFPIGAAVAVSADADASATMLAADPGLGERPESTTVLSALLGGIRSDRERWRAVALAADVSLVDGSDAVRVEVEHREGVALDVVVPYRRRRFPRSVSTGEPSAGVGERRVWKD